MMVRSEKSAPAQKCSPSPESSTTRTSGSRPSSPKAFAIDSSMAIEIALRWSGRSNVTAATRPSRSTRTSVIRSLDHRDDVALLDDAAFLDPYLRDRAGHRRLHRDL